MGKLRYGYRYGYEFLYPPPLKQAQECSKQIRNRQDIAKTSILAYLSHFLSILDVLGLVLSGKTRGLWVGYARARVQVRPGVPGARSYPCYSLFVPDIDNDNEDVIMLPDNLFISLTDTDLQQRIENCDAVDKDVTDALATLLEQGPTVT